MIEKRDCFERLVVSQKGTAGRELSQCSGLSHLYLGVDSWTLATLSSSTFFFFTGLEGSGNRVT